MLKSVLKWVGGIFAALVMLLIAVGFYLHTPRPSGQAGENADTLARQVEQAVQREAWDRTAAVTWVFGGRNTHLWDRSRNLHRVSWMKDDLKVEVLQDLSAPEQGVVTVGGQPLSADNAASYLSKAYATWINDAFWLNPLVKLFDEGTVRELLPPVNGQQRLMLRYQSGGLTPGDAYLYTLDQNLMPVAWEMWVSIIPVGGVRVTWEGWQTLHTGAKVSTRHAMPFRDLLLTDVRSADSAAELNGGIDPFAPWLEQRAKP